MKKAEAVTSCVHCYSLIGHQDWCMVPKQPPHVEIDTWKKGSWGHDFEAGNVVTGFLLSPEGERVAYFYDLPTVEKVVAAMNNAAAKGGSE